MDFRALFNAIESPPRPFLPRHPLLAMEAGDISPVPYMLGYAAKEGIWRANYLLPDHAPQHNTVWRDFVRNIDKGAISTG